jgi:hypothetical protein
MLIMCLVMGIGRMK